MVIKNKLLIFCLFSFSALFSQENEKLSYKLMARPLQDSILLRWAPTDYYSWIVANKYGYRVSRTTIIRNGKYINEKPEILTSTPLKPVPLEAWEKPADIDDYSAVAAQALYGEDFEVETDGKKGMMEIFQKEQEQTSRFSFAMLAADQSVLAAKLSGLWLTDKNVKENEAYLYKLWPANTPENTVFDTVFFYTGTKEYLPLPKPLRLNAQPGDRVVNLQWESQLQEQYYNSYFVERSNDNGKTFQRLNKHPLINTTPTGKDELPYAYFMDSIPENYKKYYYRVIGVSPFGELSPPSDSVLVEGLNKINYAPTIIKHEIIDNSQVVIEWEYNNKQSWKIEGYKVLRSTSLRGKYEMLNGSIPPMIKQYKDNNPVPTAYYRVQPFNRSGLGPASQGFLVQLEDSIPPSPPVMPTAIADTTGYVKLSWQPNTEKDMYGYRVYRANGAEEEFSQLTVSPVQDTVYEDNIELKTLSKYVYYKIMAIDKRQNYSNFSKVLKLKRPDIVPPAPPALKVVQPTDNGIYLSWANSSSNDVESTGIFRNKTGTKDWNPILEITDKSQFSYVDSLVEPSTEYRYLMLAVDSTGNESEPTRPIAVLSKIKSKSSVTNLNAKYNKKIKAVILTWEVNSSTEFDRILIYRQKNNSPFQILEGLDSHKISFTDYSISKDDNYNYKIRLILKDGSYSEFSKKIMVK